MLTRMIRKSLMLRRRRLAVAALAVLLAATLVAALTTLSLEMGKKAGKELEAYGANLLLLPRAVSLPAGAAGLAFGQVVGNAYLPQRDLEVLESAQLDADIAYAPYVYATAQVQGQTVVVAGTVFSRVRALAPYWKLEGSWPDPPQAGGTGSIVGANVAKRLGIASGDELTLELGGQRQSFVVSGVAEVGGSEDSQVFIDLSAAQSLTGRQGQLDLVQIRASAATRPLPAIAAELEQRIPGARASVVGQVAQAERNVLSKVQLLMGLITAAVLLASALAVFSTVTASVLERTKEIGLMKALGAPSRRIALVFLWEAWAVGMAGGALGIVFGLGLAQLIAVSVFDTYLAFQAVAIPVTWAAALLVTTLASLWPVRSALAVQPIVALRGE